MATTYFGLPEQPGVKGARIIGENVEKRGGDIAGGFFQGNIVCSPDASAGTLIASIGYLLLGIPGGIIAALFVFIGNQHLAEIVKRYDTSRPITAGCNEPSPNNHLFKSGAIDLIGFNYHHQWVKDVPKNFPNKPFIFSESVSALQTRGYYMMPSDSIYRAPEKWWLPYTDPSYMCSAYDNMHASWSSTHEQMWDVVKHTPL